VTRVSGAAHASSLIREPSVRPLSEICQIRLNCRRAFCAPRSNSSVDTRPATENTDLYYLPPDGHEDYAAALLLLVPGSSLQPAPVGPTTPEVSMPLTATAGTPMPGMVESPQQDGR
jgi:hypothetical protein